MGEMKLIKMSIIDRLVMKAIDISRSLFGKKAVIESYLYPNQISDLMEWDEFVETGINHNVMLKSTYDMNWYTVSKEGKLVKANNELADKLDEIDYRVRQMSQVNKKEAADA
jgi:hypothetical protein